MMTSENKPEMRSYDAVRDSFTNGSDSPRAFMDRCIADVERLDDSVKAFVITNQRAAREAADASSERWQAGAPISRIDGMPVGVKDIMETADMPTAQGSPLFIGWQGGRDCAAVAALRDAGAIMLGKTVTTEFAATHPGSTRNPWDLERTPGGSSSGSAASVATGMVSAALGSQVIGSTIRPASYCGAFGYKPSLGGINRGGSFDGFSQSCTGIIAASLAECWVVTREITSRTGGDAGYVGVIGPMEPPASMVPGRVALLHTAGWENLSESVKAELQRSIAVIEEAGVDVQDRASNAVIEEVEEAIADAMQLSMSINAWEGRWPLDTYNRDMNSSLLSGTAHDRLKQAQAMSQDEFAELLAERDKIRAIYAKLGEEFDASMTLSAPGAAPKGLDWTGDPIFTVPTSLVGMPTVSLPVLQDDGLPLGLQVMGFTNRDAHLFGVAQGVLEIL